MDGENKRPQYITYFKHKAPQDESDFFQLISMLFGIASFMLKVSNFLFLDQMGNLA